MVPTRTASSYSLLLELATMLERPDGVEFHEPEHAVFLAALSNMPVLVANTPHDGVHDCLDTPQAPTLVFHASPLNDPSSHVRTVFTWAINTPSCPYLSKVFVYRPVSNSYTDINGNNTWTIEKYSIWVWHPEPNLATSVHADNRPSWWATQPKAHLPAIETKASAHSRARRIANRTWRQLDEVVLAREIHGMMGYFQHQSSA